jgi:hypothetical protein
VARKVSWSVFKVSCHPTPATLVFLCTYYSIDLALEYYSSLTLQRNAGSSCFLCGLHRPDVLRDAGSAVNLHFGIISSLQNKKINRLKMEWSWIS